MHTTLHHQLDPSLQNMLQHRFCVEKKNIKAEIAWSQFRRQFTPGYKNILDRGVNNGLYDPGIPLEKYLFSITFQKENNIHIVSSLVFCWLAILWLQAEIDKWVECHNATPRRSNKHKSLPQGIPDCF